MKPHDSSSPLDKLIQAARKAPDTRDSQAPLGFSTRIAALAFEQRNNNALSSLFERLSWKALALSCLLMAVTLASSYGLTHTTSVASTTDDEGVLSDPVSELVDLNS